MSEDLQSDAAPASPGVATDTTETAVRAGLRLEAISGPATGPIVLAPETRATIGRSQQSDFALECDTVSRAHAKLFQRGGRWLLSDLGSRHGTYLNAIRLEANRPTVLGDGDLVRIGPYTYHVSIGSAPTTLTSTLAERPDRMRRIERVGADELDRLARHRLDLLVDCAAMIHGATDEQSLAEAVLESALAGTGFHHAALLRRRRSGDDDIEVLGYRGREGDQSAESVSFSRSLLNEAATGQMVRLTELREVPKSVSIAELGITAALCAPVMLGASTAAFLYLDARGHTAPPERDAAGFCQVIARMCGLALANLKRVELELRHQALEAEITAAREAQKLMLPEEEGTAGPLRYAMEMRPGRFVAGDLFEVVQLGPELAGVCIGDVTGEGVGAGVIMAATQAHLHGELRRTGDPVIAVDAVNRYLTERSPSDKFVSIWVGLIDGSAGRLLFVDAGHGHWLYKPRGGPARRVEREGGLLVGVEADMQYHGEEIEIGPGDRLILYSDGLVEQRSAEGEQFGRERVVEALRESQSPAEDVRRVMAAIEAFAGRAEFDDDTTVASVEVMENR